MSTDEMTIALLDIQQQIATCRASGYILTANTLRHKAMSLIECFVDPIFAAELADRPQPVIRDGKAMAQEREVVDGVAVPF